MNSITFQNDLHVCGLEVISFPEGISETFDTLVQAVPGGFTRSFFGVSFMRDQKMVYVACFEKKPSEVISALPLTNLTIEKGTYLAEPIKDWRSKTRTLNQVFRKMLAHEQADHTKPCVEWYLNEYEMMCLVKQQEVQSKKQ